VLHKLQDWPSLIQRFRNLDRAATWDPPPISLQASCTNHDQCFFETGLRILAQAQNSDHRKDYHKVKYNIAILVFSIWWFAVVCAFNLLVSFKLVISFCQGFEDFPKDDRDLHQALAW